jgi:hypothetical protein
MIACGNFSRTFSTADIAVIAMNNMFLKVYKKGRFSGGPTHCPPDAFPLL